MSTLLRPFLLSLVAALALAAPARAGAPAKAAPGKKTVVVVKTNLGAFKVELDGEKAPVSAENFLKYVDDKHYDGTVFHRVISSFMIQGGGFTKDQKEKATRAPIKNEAKNGLKNVRGTIAMARTSVPDSATAQFYVNVVDNPFLDYPGQDGAGYAVFGKVVEGMETVDKIRNAKTANKGGAFVNAPVEDVVIESVRRDK